MTDRQKGTLQRWSRLKRSQAATGEKTRRGAARPVVPEDGDGREVTALSSTEKQQTDLAPQPTPVADELPDIDSLDKDSDFSAFLRQGVPEEIRRQALRVLWRSDPVLANLDGLNDYDEDFTVVHKVAEAVRTAYQAGKGYLEEENGAEATEQVGDGEETAEPADTTQSEQIATSKSDAIAGECPSDQPGTAGADEATDDGYARDESII